MLVSRRAALAAALATPLVGHAQAQQRWQMATPYGDSNFHTRNIREWLAGLEASTSGRVSVQVHSNGSLLPMPQIKRGVQQGQVQLGEILLTAYANEEPFFDADAIPFLVPDIAGARRLAELQKKYIEARLARQGLMLLYSVAWPPAGFYTNEPLTSVEQLRGTRFRTFSPMTNRFAALVGATPTLVQAAELAQAFATGVVQAQVTSAQTGVDTSAWDYCKVFTPANFSMTKNAVFISRRAFESLSRDDQALLRATALQAEERGFAVAAANDAEMIGRLREKGMTIGTLAPNVLADLRRIGATMQREWVERAGPDGARLLEEFRSGAA
jgi:TRAP-type C4-dicarboxylate transport system substrate-binding protein